MSTEFLLAGKVTVRRAGAADADALLQLHRAGYDSDRTQAEWRWRFLDNPLGQMVIVGAFTASGDCAAAFCGVYLPCRFRSDTGWMCRAGDVVIHPQIRKTIAGPRLLLKVASAFVHEVRAAGALAIFGFPEPGLSRTLVGKCRYEVMGDVHWLTRPAQGLTDTESDLCSHRTRHLPADVDTELQAIDAHASYGLVRNRAYLEWRYPNDDNERYHFVTVRAAGGDLRACAVLRQGGIHDEAVMVLECITAPNDRAARHAVLVEAAAFAGACSCSNVVTCVAASDPSFLELQDGGFRVMVSPYQFVYRPYHRKTSRRTMFENWRYSPGDLDFL